MRRGGPSLEAESFRCRLPAVTEPHGVHEPSDRDWATRNPPTVAPMREPRRNFRPGPRAQAYLRWALCSPCRSLSGSRAATRELAAPSVKQRRARSGSARLAAYRPHRAGQPAGSVRGPRHVVTSEQAPVLDPAEARAARQHRCRKAYRPARSRVDRAHGLFRRPPVV
jgi:hypothetical protein